MLRGKDMSIEPSLATSREPLADQPGRRFHLREGVTCHDGAAFTADDVLLCCERGTAEQSDVKSWFAPVAEVRVVDDFTVEFVTKAPNPVQDVERLRTQDGIQTFEGIEARVIMLGFGHGKDTLNGTDAPNPFQDVRVRQAVAMAVNVDAIGQVLMASMSEPASQLIPAGLSGLSAANDTRPALDPGAGRALLADAGYPDGLAVDFKCTNDRDINDEAVCQAITGMLAQIGIEARLDAMPVRTYWDELRAGNDDMYLLGWSPGTFDAEHPIRFLAHKPTEQLGTWNFGVYANARVDALLPLIQQEIAPAERQVMIDEALAILQDEVAYVPLYVEPLAWAVRDGIDLVQRPDNFFMLRRVQVE